MRLGICIALSALLHVLVLSIAAREYVAPNLSISFLQEGSVLTVTTKVRQKLAPLSEPKPAPQNKEPQREKKSKTSLPKEQKKVVPDTPKQNTSSPPPDPNQAYQSRPVDEPRLVDAREYRSNPPPRYPEFARRRKQEGTVYIVVEIDSGGNVKGARIKQSSGHAILDEAAKNAVLAWKFSPVAEGNTQVANRVLVPISFRLTR